MYTHIHIRMYLRTYIHAYIHMGIHASMDSCIRRCVRMSRCYMYTYPCITIYIWVYRHTPTLAHRHVRIYFVRVCTKREPDVWMPFCLPVCSQVHVLAPYLRPREALFELAAQVTLQNWRSCSAPPRESESSLPRHGGPRYCMHVDCMYVCMYMHVYIYIFIYTYLHPS